MACLCNLCMQLRNKFPFTPRDSNCLTVASAYTAAATPKMMGFLSIMAEGAFVAVSDIKSHAVDMDLGVPCVTDLNKRNLSLRCHPLATLWGPPNRLALIL